MSLLSSSGMYGGNPIYLPLQSSKLDKVESAFLNDQGLPHYNVALGLGASSRVKDGKCVDRHFSTGICWGGFEDEDTRFVNNHDHNTSCALEENWITGSAVLHASPAQGTTGNYMSTYASLNPNSKTQPRNALAAGGPCASRSYSSYGGCQNCSLSGAAVYQCGLTNNKAIWANQ